jgi:hypothetical protein
MIQDILQQPYDRSKWTGLLTELFSHVSILREPQKLEDARMDFVRDAYQLGNVRLEDGKNLAIFEVCVADKIDLTRNRVALRNLIANRIDLGTTHGVLCVFNSSDPEYRFTFICKETTMDDSGRIETTETNPKRFTYILGPGETRRTAAQRFLELQAKRDHAGIREIVEAFSVERLNKEFFEKYKEHYQAFVGHLIQDTEAISKIFGVAVRPGADEYDAACKPVRDWVKKLLGRIVFIHFIQKKGWMGCKPSSKSWKDGDPEFLKNFFSNAKDKARFYSKYLSPLFFEALNTPDRAGDIFDLTGTKVPYLNGGLFDEAEDKTRKLDFPERLFSNLFEFFSSYNFTIDENDPEEHEVGIDPEMLGHIFESLLEENKDKGAYYTPKPVVQFMCQQSLLLYLKTRLGDREGLEKLVCQKDPGDNSKGNWIRENASRIEEQLDKVTICDPAIGSGAFPMGMLQEIFWIKLALDWTLNDPVKFAEIKRRIIEHSIHGVDLDPGAIEIARLRCWLSLVVDEVLPRPLPNLEFKIHCANSLIEYMRGEPVNFLKHETLDPTSLRHIKDLEVAKTALFEASRKSEKRNARLAIYRAITELGKLEFTWMRTQEGLFGSGDKAVELDAILKDFNQLSQHLAAAEKLTAKEQDEYLAKSQQWFQDRVKPTFAWRIHFAEVFSNGGFDIIIANPPFVQQESIVDIKPLLKTRFKTYTGQADLYTYFFENSISLLKKTGTLSFITSNKYQRSRYGTSLRDLLAKKLTFDWLIDFDDAPIFSVLAYPCILLARNDKPEIEAQFKYISPELAKDKTVLSLKKLINYQLVKQSALENSGWGSTLSSIKKSPSIKKISFKTLKQWNEGDTVKRGVLTGFNEAFVVSKPVLDEIVYKDDKVLKYVLPYLRGKKDIQNAQCQFNQFFLVAIPSSSNQKHKWSGLSSDLAEKVFKKEHPSLFNWLVKYRQELIKRADKGEYYWELRSCAFWGDFKKKKVLIPTLCLNPEMAADTTGYAVNDKINFIITPRPELLSGLLMTSICWNELKSTAATRQNNYIEIKPLYLNNLLVPELPDHINLQIEKLVKDYNQSIRDLNDHYALINDIEEIVQKFLIE